MGSICSVCGKEFVCLKAHVWKAHGEGRQHKPRIGKPAWNSGLTKETSSTVNSMASSLSKTLTGKPGRKHSDATKRKLSLARKKYLGEHPESVPYRLNHSSKESYPERYFRECFANINSIYAEFPIKRFSLDFANPKTKRYFEVDGEQHYVDSKIIDHDIKRTHSLTKLGWAGTRIRWSHFSKLSFDERSQIVSDIIKYLS